MTVCGWGKNPRIENPIWINYETLQNQSFSIRGNGRSYGDASLNDTIFSALTDSSFIEIVDQELIVSANMILRDVLNFCLSNSFILPVIPGTYHVTIGGMVASDVHGKNHKTHGSIGNWINGIWLRVASDEVLYCDKQNNMELFAATIGGMGLTGIIEKVKIGLETLPSSSLTQSVAEFETIGQLMNNLKENQSDFSTAWIDLLNQSKFVLLEQNWSNSVINSQELNLKNARVSIPKLSFSLLSKTSMRIYNNLKFKSYKRESVKKIGLKENFFPLDSLGNWNNLYGKKGFYQYQCVIPEMNALNTISEMIEKVKRSGVPPYLVVLKYFGAIKSLGMLSFPIQGYTICFDFPANHGIEPLFQVLDELVIGSEGRVYLTKDAKLEANSFKKMYPNHEIFRNAVKTHTKFKVNSMLSKRLKMIE